MPRPVAQTGIAADRQIGERQQLPVPEAVNLESAGVFRFVSFGFVATGDQDDRAIAGCRQDLMREYPEVELGCLLYPLADRAIAVDPMNSQIARIVVTSQGVVAPDIQAVVDRALRQY